MNIYFLDENPHWAARFHVDRHVASQIGETARILQAAHVMLDGVATAKMRTGNLVLVRNMHMNHPYAGWTRANSANYEWTAQLFAKLLLEYELRFMKVHAYQTLADMFQVKPLNIERGELSPMTQHALAPRFRSYDAVLAHRMSYLWLRDDLAQWSLPAKTPQWWQTLREREKVEA